MIKRNLGSYLRGRSYWSQSRDMTLLTLTHNAMIIWRAPGGFLQSTSVAFVMPRQSEITNNVG